MDEENTHSDTRSLVLAAIAETKTTAFLELCYVVYNATDHEEQAKKALEEITDLPFMRMVKELEALTEENEHKVYYYGPDDRSPRTLQYREELEKSIRLIRNYHLYELSQILKELNQEEMIDL